MTQSPKDGDPVVICTIIGQIHKPRCIAPPALPVHCIHLAPTPLRVLSANPSLSQKPRLICPPLSKRAIVLLYACADRRIRVLFNLPIVPISSTEQL